MKYIFFSLVISMLAVSCINNPNETTKDNLHKQDTAKQLRHAVFFKFNETSSPEDIKKLEDAFAALPSKIKEIKDFEWGMNNSPEGLHKDFTHCFFVTFNSEDDRATYLPHPDHKAFVAMLGPHVADVLVFDYWAK